MEKTIRSRKNKGNDILVYTKAMRLAKKGRYIIAKVKNPDNICAVLKHKEVPPWFLYLGHLANMVLLKLRVFSQNTRISSSNN